MNSKERTKRTIDFIEPDRVPFQILHDEAISPHIPNIYREVLEETENNDNLKMFQDLNYLSIRLYDMDIVMAYPIIEYPQLEVDHSDGRDWYRGPLLKSLKNIDSLNLPDPGNDEVYKDIKEATEKYKDKYIIGSTPGILYYYHILRGYQNMMIDIFDDPKGFHKTAEKITTIQEKAVTRMMDYEIDSLLVGDDICGRTGLMMSNKHLDEYVWRYNTRIIEIGKSSNIPVFYHTDGASTEIFEKLISLGVKGINPLQYHLHDLGKLKKRYGKDLIFFGCIDNSYILREGTPDEVEKHILEVFDLAGNGGGLIMSPSSVSYTTPRENVQRMVDTIKNKCIY